jgi:hypothetical protein
LSPILGAGKKENNNTFTGVLMGDLRKFSDNKKTSTGLYGF